VVESRSISHWIASLKVGDMAAAQMLWSRFADRLIELAARRMQRVPNGLADEEDIAQSVFYCVCRGATSGRFDDVLNRDDLWWLLLAITNQKIVSYIRRETAQKRGGGKVKTECSLPVDPFDSQEFSLDHLIGRSPTPEVLAMLDEQSQRLLRLLRDDSLRQIAISRIEGYTVPEIASNMAVSTRSVERKLKLIRNAWSKELSSAS
jgi:DNA-directed RNA polymerase specialized sigma24 family protein